MSWRERRIVFVGSDHEDPVMPIPRSLFPDRFGRRRLEAARQQLARLKRALAGFDAKPTLRSAHGVDNERQSVVSGRWR